MKDLRWNGLKGKDNCSWVPVSQPHVAKSACVRPARPSAAPAPSPEKQASCQRCFALSRST